LQIHALIFCAGLGTRLGKLTKDTPKAMIKIGDKPILEHLVDHLNKYDIDDIAVNLYYKPEKIVKHFGKRLTYFYEPELLGEARTEKRAKFWLGEQYILMNGDTLTDININDMIDKMLFLNGNVAAYDGAVYTGITLKNVKYDKTFNVEFGNYWQDMGTPDGLRKARKDYEKKLSSLS